MATTTTNYSFDVPTSSDLVKNGATQIALLGQDLDTFLFRPFTKNVLINGGFDIWQRGTTFAQNLFNADRWYGTTASGTATYAREATIKPVDTQYSLKLTQTGTSATFINQAVETLNAVGLAGQTVTYSYEAASSSTINVTPYLYYSTSTDVGVTGSWTLITATTTSSISVNGTASFQKISATYSVPSTAKSIMVGIGVNLTSSLTVYVAKAQLEVGSQASPFTRAGGTIQGELAMCQRYYYRASIAATPARFAFGYADSTTKATYGLSFPVQMRTAPTALEQSGTAGDYSTVGPATTITVCSAVPTFGVASSSFASFDFTVTAGLVAGQGHSARPVNTNAYLGWSAEL
jgi:hypothetical protein